MSGYTNPPPMDATSPTSDDEEPTGTSSSARWNIGPAATNADCTSFFNTCCGAIFICCGEYLAIFTGCFECCESCCVECLKCGCNS
ncbi:uncharacterized protein H6S33_002819 [Morchella sextelata]|uniref:uncharacterized protein n=1 Tax=Morchella sextelata TaxID=1174677 RepID=UPI001D0542E2|nr:uncharacterized protein H6S33_002819 [Morchella sextelata]KAH0607785.1 hypothetical protein H6S33_002819 [Morchella sextelata]